MEKRLIRKVGAVLALGAALALAACGGGADAPETHAVSYKVAGVATSRARITYAPSDGDTAQVVAPLPWVGGLHVAKPREFLYVSAQNDSDTGFLIVEIQVDGKPWKTVTSSGAFAIGTASGSCC